MKTNPKGVFYIEDIFNVAGSGTVAVGRMSSGNIDIGDYLSMPDGKMVMIGGIEEFMKSFGMKGDNLGVLLKGVTKDYVGVFRKYNVDVLDISQIRDDKLNQLGI